MFPFIKYFSNPHKLSFVIWIGPIFSRQNAPDIGVVSFDLSHTVPKGENIFYYQIAEVYDPEQATGYLYAPPIFAKVTVTDEGGTLSSTVEYYTAFDERPLTPPSGSLWESPLL